MQKALYLCGMGNCVICDSIMYNRPTLDQIQAKYPSCVLSPDLEYELAWWRSHYTNRHPSTITSAHSLHDYACDAFRFIYQQNEWSINMRQAHATINATALQKSLFPGVTIGKKGCSDGREKKSVFVGKTFKGVKGPGGVARITQDGNGSRLASEILCAGITESTSARDEIFELFVGHESRINPITKGCAAQNAAFRLHHGREPSGMEVRDFTRSQMAETLDVFDRHVNDERSYYQLPSLALSSTVAYRNTDDLSISLCHPDAINEFDVSDFALRHRNDLQQLFSELDTPSRNLFASYKLFQSTMCDPGGIPLYESSLASAMDAIVHSTNLKFASELRKYASNSPLVQITERQFAGLVAFMARNLAIVYGTGYVYENALHRKEQGYYPKHFFADHREITLVVSRRGKHPGISCPHLQFLLSSPETQSDAVTDVALLAAGVLKKYSPDKAHPLIIADTDAGTLRSYTAAIINASETSALLGDCYIFPVPVLIDEDRRIKQIGVTL